MMHVIPMKRLATISTMYAVLGSLNKKEAGYIIGVIDHLKHTDMLHLKIERLTKSGRS